MRFEVLKGGVVVHLRLGGRDVADRLHQVLMVEPVDPFEGLDAGPVGA